MQEEINSGALTRTINRRGWVFGPEFFFNPIYSFSRTHEFLSQVVFFPLEVSAVGTSEMWKEFLYQKLGQDDFSGPLQSLNSLTHFDDDIIMYDAYK